MALHLFLRGSSLDVTLETARIVGTRALRERLVRIVASNACDPGVLLFPTPAVFKTVGRKPDIQHPDSGQPPSDNILPGAVARATKVNGINRGQAAWIQNQLRGIFRS